jgi:hypothetical protein
MDANSLEIAWCAGIFEGEGYIYRCSARPGTIRLGVKMTDADVLSRYAAIMEGKIAGPYDPGGGRKLAYVWSDARQKHVIVILDAFWSYLGERRRARAIELGYIPQGATRRQHPGIIA